MHEPEEVLAHIWDETLSVVDQKGWMAASRRLRGQLRALRDRPDAGLLIERDSTALVLGTLQQKFGELSQASKTLEVAQNSLIPSLSYEATGALAKVQSQRGDFCSSLNALQKLLADVPPHSEAHPSTYWRLGLAAALERDRRLSQSSFDDHHQRVMGLHPSQLANSLVFRTACDILGEIGSPELWLADLGRAFVTYLSAAVRTDSSIKFVNVAKSLLLPMALGGYVSQFIGRESEAIVQSILVRELMRFESLGGASEGIAELAYVLRQINPDCIPLGCIQRVNSSETKFRTWLDCVVNDERRVTQYVEEAKSRFSDFLVGGNFSRFWVDRSYVIGGSTHRGLRVYFHWKGQRELGLEMRLFMVEELGAKIVDLESSLLAGLSVTDRVVALRRTIDVAVVHLDESLSVFIGRLVQAMGADKCLILEELGDSERADLETGAFGVDLDSMPALKERLRKLIPATREPLIL